jgi:hypothetical protein
MNSVVGQPGDLGRILGKLVENLGSNSLRVGSFLLASVFTLTFCLLLYVQYSIHIVRSSWIEFWDGQNINK